MGTSYSPSTVTDGLIFYYDEANLKKSWKGEPTTNLAVTSGSVTDWTIANLAASVTRGTITPDKKYSITSTTGGAFRMNFNLSNLVDTETYTLSFKYKIISGGPKEHGRLIPALIDLWILLCLLIRLYIYGTSN